VADLLTDADPDADLKGQMMDVLSASADPEGRIFIVPATLAKAVEIEAGRVLGLIRALAEKQNLLIESEKADGLVLRVLVWG